MHLLPNRSHFNLRAISDDEFTVLTVKLFYCLKAYWIRLPIVMRANTCLHCEQLSPIKLEIKVEEKRYLGFGDRKENNIITIPFPALFFFSAVLRIVIAYILMISVEFMIYFYKLMTTKYQLSLQSIKNSLP